MAYDSNDRFLITGGIPLSGDVYISGGKNTAVAIIPAALLSDDVCIIENIPDIEDVNALIDILRYLGAKVDFLPNNRLIIDPTTVNKTEVPLELSGKLRASYYLLGALVGKHGEAKVYTPGGCQIGISGRPTDQHMKGFRQIGIEASDSGDILQVKSSNIKGGMVTFDVISVGATMNIMMAAVRAKGTTIIMNAAKEPHIVDLANFLGALGADIRGAATDKITIRGRNSLHGCTYRIIPDQIETGTMMIAAAATHGEICIHDCIPRHMEALTAKLLELGVRVSDRDDTIIVAPIQQHRSINITTQVYPGFPTDLQQPMTSLLTLAKGESRLTEAIYDNRFNHIPSLQNMGANISRTGRTIIINGVTDLYGNQVTATDLRAGASLIIAGLMAKGLTEISGVNYIDRGYDHIEEKLKKLGADIKRIS